MSKMTHGETEEPPESHIHKFISKVAMDSMEPQHSQSVTRTPFITRINLNKLGISLYQRIRRTPSALCKNKEKRNKKYEKSTSYR